ncbi:hypothetical protein BaRGS_00038786 [Batillaria attramentaria]|uniref:Uncharacterized protein n=1 Tax=Batillaria attramentaria TaxID=370345 RepID=A0ABD0J5T5_9CAEN
MSTTDRIRNSRAHNYHPPFIPSYGHRKPISIRSGPETSRRVDNSLGSSAARQDRRRSSWERSGVREIVCIRERFRLAADRYTQEMRADDSSSVHSSPSAERASHISRAPHKAGTSQAGHLTRRPDCAAG